MPNITDLTIVQYDRIRGAYTDCIRSCIENTMEAQYGDRAFDALNEMDQNRVRTLRANGKHALPLFFENDGFDRLDPLILIKAVCCLPMLQGLLKARYGIESEKFSAVRGLTYQLVGLFTKWASVHDDEGSDLLEQESRCYCQLIEQLFPNEPDPLDPNGRTYLTVMLEAMASWPEPPAD